MVKINIPDFTKVYGVLFFNLYIWYSLFMSKYFYQLPSSYKEFFSIPFVLLFLFSLFNKFDWKFNRFKLFIFFYVSILIAYSFIGILNSAPDPLAIRYYIIPLSFFWVSYTYGCNEYYRRIEYSIFLYFMFVLCIGYFQILSSASLLQNLIIDSEAADLLKVNRFYLFYLIPNLAGGVIASLSFCLFLLSKNLKLKLANIVITLPVIFFVFSRTAIFAYIAAILIYTLLHSGILFRVILFFLILLLLNFAVNFSISDEAFIERIAIQGVTISNKINIWGNGVGFITSSGSASEITVLDNDFLRFVYEMGLVGFVSIVFFFILLYKFNKSSDLLIFIILICLQMTTGELHSMYPIPVIAYIGFAIIAYNKKKEVL